MALDPLTAAALKTLGSWWLEHRPIKAARLRRKNRRRAKQGLPPLEEPQMTEENTPLDDEDTKGPFKSLAVQGVLIGVVSYFLNKAGYVGVDAGELVNQIMTIVTEVGVLVGLVTALVGRLRATKRIG